MEIHHLLNRRKLITSIVPSADIGIWWTTIHQDPASINHRPNTVFGMPQVQKAKDCGKRGKIIIRDVEEDGGEQCLSPSL